MRVEREGGTAAWLMGTLAASSVQGHGLPPPQELWPSQSFFMEKAMAPHSSTLAWEIPWTEEPGGLQSTGSLGVRHD